jgi:hypothetical protein
MQTFFLKKEILENKLNLDPSDIHLDLMLNLNQSSLQSKKMQLFFF